MTRRGDMRSSGRARRAIGMLSRLGGLRCGLVLLLLVTHLALMTTERHVAVMGPLMGAGPAPAALGPLGQATAAPWAVGSGEDTPEAPHRPVLGDCPVQQAIMPLLLVLLILGGLIALRSVLSCEIGRPSGWHLRHPLPPPLTPARRRALLQVFLN